MDDRSRHHLLGVMHLLACPGRRTEHFFVFYFLSGDQSVRKIVPEHEPHCEAPLVKWLSCSVLDEASISYSSQFQTAYGFLLLLKDYSLPPAYLSFRT